MKHNYISIIVTLLTLIGFSNAQTQSGYQSPARPYNLDIVSPVMLAGSDPQAQKFQSDILPSLIGIQNRNLFQTFKFNDWANLNTNPSLLTLSDDATVRAYFVGENAGFRNSIGFSTKVGAPTDPTAKLIFPDFSGETNASGDKNLLRNDKRPLVSGDFVDIGLFPFNQKLDFFLIADGANGGRRFFSTDHSLNGDGLFHSVFFKNGNSNYLVIGFEDIWGGGDKDFNDTIFVLEFTPVPTTPSLGVPEPNMTLGLCLMTIFGLGVYRRRI
jgi:hypothetical protein